MRNAQKKQIKRVSAGQRNREKERKRTWRKKECTGVRAGSSAGAGFGVLK